jgi:BirA family biotin operon repressor/biotin-[acetyl-CoA-carboxylase] ligase
LYKTPAKTLFLGQNLIFMPECHSTNTVAIQLCQQPSVTEGTVVITDRQTAGRGQRGNSWQAEPGMNLTFSFILKPAFLSARELFFLNMAISLGLYDFLNGLLDVDVRVKWPNDLLVKDRKVCGILIENSVQGAAVGASVVGVGLNVNQEQFDHPRAASVRTFSGKAHALQDVLDELLPALERRYLQLREGKRAEITAAYYACLYGFGEEKMYRAVHEGTEFIGKITGVDEIGRVRIETRGVERVFGLKEVELVG